MGENYIEPDMKNTHPNFTIICDKCGSKNVYVNNTVGFSRESGAWGSVDLVCDDCGQTTTIWEA